MHKSHHLLWCWCLWLFPTCPRAMVKVPEIMPRMPSDFSHRLSAIGTVLAMGTSMFLSTVRLLGYAHGQHEWFCLLFTPRLINYPLCFWENAFSNRKVFRIWYTLVLAFSWGPEGLRGDDGFRKWFGQVRAYRTQTHWVRVYRKLKATCSRKGFQN